MTAEWPCQVCRIPDRKSRRQGEACEQCKRDLAAFFDEPVPSRPTSPTGWLGDVFRWSA